MDFIDRFTEGARRALALSQDLSLIHISEPTRRS